MYLSLQGKAYAARVANGVPGPFFWVGNAPVIEAELSIDKFDHKESWSGQRLIDISLIKEKKMDFTLTLEDFNKKNWELVAWGSTTTIAPGTVTNEPSPSGLIAGDFLRTSKQKISSVVITDSAAIPATLTLGTHYEIISPDHGTIKLLDVTGFTQPFLIDYAHGEVQSSNIFTQPQPIVWLKFDGINTVEPFNKMLSEIYKLQLDPFSKFALIHDEIGQYELKGTALGDQTKAADAVLGQFGRIVDLS